MTIGVILCQHPGCRKEARRHQKYCSAAHAPLGRYGIADGGARQNKPPAQGQGSPDGTKPPNDAPTAAPMKKRGGRKGRTKPPPALPSGDDTPTATRDSKEPAALLPNTELRTPSASIDTSGSYTIAPSIPSGDSTGSGVTLSTEGSRSMNTLGDCERRLSELMSRLDAQSECGNPRLDTYRATAMCSCAKQLTNVVRLRFEIAKEVSRRADA